MDLLALNFVISVVLVLMLAWLLGKVTQVQRDLEPAVRIINSSTVRAVAGAL